MPAESHGHPQSAYFQGTKKLRKLRSSGNREARMDIFVYSDCFMAYQETRSASPKQKDAVPLIGDGILERCDEQNNQQTDGAVALWVCS
jgi:hypothetical protein